MPILLNDLQSSLAAANVKVFTPKFFDSKLTGRGGTTARFLSARNNPASVDPSVVTSPSDKECVRRSYRSGQTTVNRIPMNLIPVRAWEYMRKIKRPDLNDMVCVAKNTSGDEIYLCMEIQTISIEEATTELRPSPKKISGPITFVGSSQSTTRTTRTAAMTAAASPARAACPVPIPTGLFTAPIRSWNCRLGLSPH